MNFVFDMDGTVCFDGQTIDKKLTDFMTEYLHHSAQHQLIFASARPVRDMLPLLPKSLQDCHLIGSNGAMLYSELKPQWFQTIDQADFSYIREYVYQKKLDYLFDEQWNYSCVGETLMTLRQRLDSHKQAKNLPITAVTNPVKILVSNYLNEQEVLADFSSLTVDCNIYPSERCLDVTRKGVNKASAIERLLGESDYVAFGNDRNDIKMLERANYGICVGNSQEVGKIADRVIKESPEVIIEMLREIVA